MIIVDSHEDIAYNILTFGRDYTRPAAETRRSEAGADAPLHNGDTLLGWPDYQRGKVAVVFGTLFAVPANRKNAPAWETQSYSDYSQAYDIYSRQVDAYHRLTGDNPDKFRLILTKGDLDDTLKPWIETLEAERAALETSEREEEHNELPELRRPPQMEGLLTQNPEGMLIKGNPVGVVVLMEGAEGVHEPAELEEWWARGVRIIGPAWTGTRFCGGTGQPGPLTSEGYALLEGMAGLGFTLDLSHMDEQAVYQALDFYEGPIIASHANAIALLKGLDTNRHLSNRTIQGIVERDGVIGIVPYNPFLLPGWKQPDRRELVSLDRVTAQIDHICQIAGDARHVGIGSDFDGGFGVQSVPAEIDTVADLQKIGPLLFEKGYAAEDVAAILGGNWLNHLRKILPDSA
jgi:membrane dipeptidase